MMTNWESFLKLTLAFGSGEIKFDDPVRPELQWILVITLTVY